MKDRSFEAISEKVRQVIGWIRQVRDGVYFNSEASYLPFSYNKLDKSAPMG